MLEHFKLLSYLISLFSGIWVLSYLTQVYKSYPDKVIKAIIIFTLWYFILTSLQFLRNYIRNNLGTADLDPYTHCILFSINLGFVFSLYLTLNILLSFRGISIKKTYNGWFILITSLIIISYILKSFIPELQGSFVWLEYFELHGYSFVSITSYIELLVLIGFYFIWGKSKPTRERIKISKSFTLIYIISIEIPAVLFSLSMYYIVQSMRVWLIINFFTSLIFVLFIYLWTKFIFLDYAQKSAYLVSKSDKFKDIYKKHKISKRESEIIELLMEGKSSNEIKENLFISYHTVKNHISHIYQKLNVKNRHELIHFFVKIK